MVDGLRRSHILLKLNSSSAGLGLAVDRSALGMRSAVITLTLRL